MRRDSRPGIRKGAALLWDESFLWGLMAYKALKGSGLPFELIRAEDVRAGALDGCRMLFVPGGWASNKRKVLGDAGIEAIRDFVRRGGNYLGICGGAGLATRAEGGLGLLGITRKRSEDRVPSFNGRIRLNVNEHPLWEADGTDGEPHVFHAWWPSQFQIEDRGVRVLATYGEALPESFSSDLNVGDVRAGVGWSELERIYRINLDPERLRDEPAVVEGSYGRGRVVLSLVHFDTPGDGNGRRVLRNLWGYLAGGDRGTEGDDGRAADGDGRTTTGTSRSSELCDLGAQLIRLGERNFLWFWRTPMLLLWRRGVRGLEYNTLYVMLKELHDILRTRGRDLEAGDAERIKALLVPFVEKAGRLLMLERCALHNGHITYKRCEDPEIQRMRRELFSPSKHHGGLFKRLIDEVDRVLYSLIR